MKNSKERNAVVIVLLLITLGVGWFAYPKNNENIPDIPNGNTGTEFSATTEWQTYHNDEYGFEFKYPSGYTYAENKAFNAGDTETKLEIITGDQPVFGKSEGTTLYILIRTTSYSSLSDTVAWWKNGFKNVTIAEKNIGGVDFTIISYADPAGGTSEVAYVEHKGLIYAFTPSSPEGKNILETFKFNR